jgi:DNA-binding NtrC family response regulator
MGQAPHIIALGRAGSSVPAVEAILCGASDYLLPPLRARAVRDHLHTWQQQRQAQAQESFTSSGLIYPAPATEPTLIGNSAPWLQVVKQLAQALAADASLNSASIRPPSFFLAGETGTGKELFARLIHQRSPFSNGPFVAVNCAALPHELAEAELFGHQAGAFTGAHQAQPGLWAEADGGTLFLDEITETPPALLPKLLRVLQDGQVKRLGSARWQQTRVQVIAASNRDVPQAIAIGGFRRDLYQRFLHHLHLPPLRERREDLPLLIQHFVQRYTTRPVQFSLEAWTLLQGHDWPGNVRELENLLRAALTHTGEGRVTAVLLRTLWREKASATTAAALPLSFTATAALQEQASDFKRRTATEMLARCRGNITKTAQALGLSRPTLYRWLDDA